MAATIQNIELPKKPRALDSSTSTQEVSQEILANVGLGSSGTINSTSYSLGWTSSGSEVSIASNRLVLTNGSGSPASTTTDASNGTDSNVLVAGNTYTLTYTVVSIDTGNNDVTVMRYYAGSNISIELDESVGTHSVTFIAGDANATLGILNGTDDSILILDDISLKQVDTFSNNNHGKIYSGRALEFDGVTDYFQNNGGASLTGVNSFANGVSWTFACWMYFDSAGDGEDHFIGHDSTTQNHLTFNHSSNILRFRDNSADYYTFSSTSLNEDTWYRIAITTDGTKLTAYANGIVYGTIEANQANDDADDNFDNTTMEFSGWGCPYTSEGNRAGHFMGMMSDGQVWDATWSADDAAYDFANPESLALNASGTALTESNLKVWYPMQDGHRGQQSYILDGASTGLGVNLITNGDFEGITLPAGSADEVGGWQNNTTTTNGWSIAGGKAFLDGEQDTTPLLRQDGVLSAPPDEGSVVYKCVVTISNRTAGNVRFNIGGYQTFESYDTNGTHTSIVKPTHTSSNTSAYIQGSSDFAGSIDNVEVYAINDKHNATTVFHGDELVSSWTNVNFDNFNSSGSNITQMVSGADNDRCVASATMVAGRAYKLQFTSDQALTTGECQVRIAPNTALTSATVVFGEIALGSNEATFIAAANYTHIGFRSVSAFSDTQISSFSLKEVGVASGWTDADQQLDIAQPALQSYNELAWFPGVDPGGSTDYSINCTSGTSIDNVWVGGGTASAWIFPNSMGEGDKGRVFDKTYWHIHLITLSGNACKIRFEHGRDTANHTTTIDNHNIQLGEWNHIAITYDKSSPSTVAKIYVNGVLRDATVVAGSGTISNDAASTLYIGNTSSGSKTFGGCITEASLWTNTLTATEVLELYNEGKALDATLHSSYVSAASDLKGYWRNNGLSTWTDLSDNSNNGTVNNITETLLIPQGVDGSRCSQGFIMNKSRNTSSFNKPDDGDVSHVQKSTSPVTGSNAMTLSAWIKPKRVGSTFEGFVTMGDHAANKSFWIGLFGNGNYGGGINGGNIDTGDAAVAGDWVHLALTYAGGSSGALILYKNGVADGNTTCTAAIPTNDTAYVRVGSIGVTGEANNYPATSGQVDGVLIYNKALSATEVLRNYKATKGSHRN